MTNETCPYCGVYTSNLDGHIDKCHTNGWNGRIEVSAEEPNGYKFTAQGNYGQVQRQDGEELEGFMEDEDEEEEED